MNRFSIDNTFLALARGVVRFRSLVVGKRGHDRYRHGALGTTVFAILGFIVGVTYTVNGGATVDLIYHATLFPVLIVTALMLGRAAGPAALGE